MNLHDIIYTRRTVRAYASTPVERETIQELIDAAVQAPTGMNAQPWAFGVITDPTALHDLSVNAKAHLLSQMASHPAFERYRQMLENPEFDIFYGAPALVVIYGAVNAPTKEIDCCLAAENLILSAWEKGLGSCWVGFAMFYLGLPEVKAALGVPAEYDVIAPLILGRPAAAMPPVEKNAPQIFFWK